MSEHKYTQLDLTHAIESANGETWATVFKVTGLKPRDVMDDEILGAPVFAWLLERHGNPKASLKFFWALPASDLEQYLDVEPMEDAEVPETAEDLPKK